MKEIIGLVVFNLVFSPLLISILRKLGFYKTKKVSPKALGERNNMYYEHLLESMDTPSSFGILFILNLLFLLLFPGLLGLESISLIIIVSIFLGFLGLLDDVYQFFLYEKSGVWGIRARYKMLIQFLLFFAGFYFLGVTPLLSVLYGGAATFVLNSFNITDGLDGLAAGTALPSLLVLIYLEYILHGNGAFFKILIVTLLFLAIFLLFNFKPAKVWLGDSGSYAIGAILAFAVFRYDIFLTFPLILIFLIEGLSSLFQIFSIKFMRRKMFKIAPLHLHLLNSGWSQWKVILTAWITQIVISVIVLGVQIYVK